MSETKVDEKPNMTGENMEQYNNSQQNVNETQNNSSEIIHKKDCFSSKKKRNIVIILIIVGVILVGILISVIIILLNRGKDNGGGGGIIIDEEEEKKEPEETEEKEDTIPPQTNPEPLPDDPDESQIKKEFEINTKKGDLRRISIVQNSKEETKFNNEPIKTDITRKTNYIIDFINEEKSTGKYKKFYSKMYTGVVAIESECTSVDNDNCEPKPLIDLDSKIKNLRSLNSEYLKDKAIPICVFNITDNHIITTMICPEALPDNKRNEIILDLYFFRPPAAERADKKRDNITLTIEKGDDKTTIHETNGGYCNLFNNWGSQCTTEMTTILDKEGNVISYNEEAITKINYDEKNSYKKDKKTNLIDNSSTIKKNNIKNYQIYLDELLEKLETYMKEEIQFDYDEYEDLYNVIMDAKYSDNKSTEEHYIPTKRRNTFRNLNHNTGADKFIQLMELFSNKITPVQIDIDFKINPGLNSDKIGAYGILKLDDQQMVYSSIEENSVIQDVIDKLSSLSKSGNYLATELYDKIYKLLEKLSSEVSIQVNTLDELIMYYDISKVFNTTLIELSYRKLPIEIIELSNKLVRTLNSIFKNIKLGDIKYYVEKLHDDIYNYIHDLHELIREILNNLETLSNVLLTKENRFTKITNYYLNNTSASYYNIIYKIQIILQNYFIHEYEKIYPKVQDLIEKFELNSDEILENELKQLKDLYNDIKNKNLIIESITESDFKTVLSNLNKSYIYPGNIIDGIKKYINEMMNIKENNYFTSDEEIKNFTDSFDKILDDAKEVAKKLEDIDEIDFIFDKIMIKFREGYIDTIQLMDKIKTGNFTLEEDILKNTLFTTSEKTKTENDLKKLCDDIIEKIKKEKNSFTEKIQAYITIFLNIHIENLNDKITDLIVILSEEVLLDIQQSFEISLNNTLEKLSKLIDENIKLTKNYFDKYYKMITDKNELEMTLLNAYLYNFKNNSYFYTPSDNPEFIYIRDTVNETIKRTSAYLTKYNKFMECYNDTEQYLKEQLYYDIITQYRDIFSKIKEELQSIIDNKLSEKFADFDEFNFFDRHIGIIDELKSRLDKYFSDTLFDKKYLKYINESIDTNIKIINSTKEYINEKHESIKTFTAPKDDTKDICVSFYRKTCYGCTNCVEYVYFFDNFCFDLSPYQYNYLSLKKLNYDEINNFDDFNLMFVNLNNKINETVNSYNSIIIKFNLNITIIKEELLKEKIIGDYLEPLNDWVNLILNQKFEKTIVKSTYDYYQSNLNTKLENIFTDIFNRWTNLYETLEEDIDDNELDIKYSMYEFTNMAYIYKTLILTDLLENYYNSIIHFEKSEINYSISYYYDYFIKLIDKYYKYIIQNIPINADVYKDILTEKKLEIKNNFDNINKKISDSEINCLDIENQISILETNNNDFFKNKNLLTKNILKINTTLDDIIENIEIIETFIPEGDKYSLIMRYYLENKELGKLIERLYEPIDNGNFFYLNINKFKDIMLDKWFFDKKNFANILDNILYETNIEIKKELNLKIKKYYVSIQNELDEFFDEIEKFIFTIFKNQINILTSSQKDTIEKIVTELISEFETKMKLEAEKIEKHPGIYKLNNETIYNYIKNYKENIKDSIKNSIFGLLDKFYENVKEAVYDNFVEEKTKIYLDKVKELLTKLDIGDYNLLNSTLKIGETINNIVIVIINNYKTIISKTITNRYLAYYEKIELDLNLKAIYLKIENDLENIYKTILLPKLNSINSCITSSCPVFEISENTTTYITNIISEKSLIIKKEILIMKGNNIKINVAISVDINISGINILEIIYESLKSFLSFENEEQVSRINEIIVKVIKSNLEDFLNNEVPTYGDIFFDRIIDYNINFKLFNLYENLHYGIDKSLLYYHALRVINKKMTGLPNDLKIRLYQLNDLDKTVLSKAEDIKELAEKKLLELILNLKNETKNMFISLKDDEIFRGGFSTKILEKIDNNLELIMPDLEKTYQKILEKYLKEKFMNSFSEALDNKTDYMINVFYEEKKKLIDRLDDLFSSTEDKDLNEVNKNINITVESMRSYRYFLSTFKISDEVIKFLIYYSENNLLPIYKKFFADLNEKKEELIKSEIDQKSEEIENITLIDFIKKLEEASDILFDNNFDIIQKAISEYGDTETKYENNLKEKQETIKDTSNEEIIRKASKYLEDSLNQLNNKTEKAKTYINTLPAFTDTESIIQGYEYELGITYKEIIEKLKLYKYNDKIDSYLNEKLLNITIILYNYYGAIRTNFSNFKNNVLSSIGIIKESLGNITDITAKILNNKYQEISDSIKRINKIYENIEEKYQGNLKKYIQKTENMMTTVITKIKNLTEYGEFKLEFKLEGDKFKIPKLKSKIVDKTIPRNTEIKVQSDYGFCYTRAFAFYIDFNDGNFTSVLEYDTKSGIITINTYTNIKKYNYKVAYIEEKGEVNTEEISVENYIYLPKCTDMSKTNSTKLEIEVPNFVANKAEFITT